MKENGRKMTTFVVKNNDYTDMMYPACKFPIQIALKQLITSGYPPPPLIQATDSKPFVKALISIVALFSVVLFTHCSTERLVAPEEPVPDLGQAKVKIHVTIPDMATAPIGSTKASEVMEMHVMTFDATDPALPMTDAPQMAVIEVTSIAEQYGRHVDSNGLHHARKRHYRHHQPSLLPSLFRQSV